tara:strand:+ start:569 stop:823 length:255 start_codon:yes stop_codon:yes gene_type:complete
MNIGNHIQNLNIIMVANFILNNMKAILEFDLNEHDDKMSHLRCVKSLNMAIVLFELAYNTNNNFKKRFFELLEENNLTLDELIE